MNSCKRLETEQSNCFPVLDLFLSLTKKARFKTDEYVRVTRFWLFSEEYHCHFWHRSDRSCYF
jgi:hypothetical protein